MSDSFIDTNVFVYTFDERDPRKQTIARHLIADALEQHNAIVSYQVVQETLHVLTRLMPTRMPAPVAADYLEDMLLPLWNSQPTHALYRRALGLQERYQLHFYDSLIVAAAIEAGCSRIYSEDLQHGQRIEGVRIVDPFRE